MRRTNILLLIQIIVQYISCLQSASDLDQRSPYYQYLPDCNNTKFERVLKKTSKKGIICPMIKDEIGFLSEWTAYYEMQGFDHIMFFDNNSTTSLAELDPWIKTGFVSIEREWWTGAKWLLKNKKNRFGDMMVVKMQSEIMCKRRAVEWGYEIFVSIDIDEYVMPTKPTLTVMDDLVNFFDVTTRGSVLLTKLQFPPTPHVLEPVNLLTIEAYQTRMAEPGKMNYYSNVAAKVALRLQGSPEYSNSTTEFLVHCCDFHGCPNFKHYKGCRALYEAGEQWKFDGKHRKWAEIPSIYHYGRTLEKYLMKQRTWETAGEGRDYDMYNFMDRLSGSRFDNSAVHWGCQLRELLRKRTGEPDYIRPGDWYRNPEFGKTVDNPRKRGRNGSGFGKYLGPSEMNPYPPGETYQRAHKPYIAQKA